VNTANTRTTRLKGHSSLDIRPAEPDNAPYLRANVKPGFDT